MPEWSALILGKARSIMAMLLNEIDISLICSTDSLLVPVELDSRVDEIMKTLGVKLTNKNGGKETALVRIIRNRVYAAIDAEENVIFGASHAIHLGRRKKNCEACKEKKCRDSMHDALRFILSEETEYLRTKRLGLKTAIRTGTRFFSEVESKMRFERRWDQKRKLLPGGHTEAWDSLEEYETFSKNLKDESHITACV